MSNNIPGRADVPISSSQNGRVNDLVSGSPKGRGGDLVSGSPSGRGACERSHGWYLGGYLHGERVWTGDSRVHSVCYHCYHS
jgi:hypothetical protein